MSTLPAYTSMVCCPDCQGAGQYTTGRLHPDTRQPEPTDCRMCDTTGLVPATEASVCIDCGRGYWLHPDPDDADYPNNGPCPDDCGRSSNCVLTCPKMGRQIAEDAAYDQQRDHDLTLGRWSA